MQIVGKLVTTLHRHMQNMSSPLLSKCTGTQFPIADNVHSPVRIVQDTRQRVIPRRERGQQAEEAAGFDDGRIGHAGAVGMQVADAEEQEGQVEGEEEGEEGYG